MGRGPTGREVPSPSQPGAGASKDGQSPAITRVVGIGASAGGLEALQELAGSLVSGGGVAYLVAQHLAPEHPSLIVDLVAHATDLRVVTAVDGDPLQADVIAIAPPNHDLAVEGDRLRLSDPLPRFGPSPSIDLLFESIAAHWGERGVAVVLSGTGADGARGVRAVRAAGGFTIAQAPESARFDGMPRAAITLGGADLVLEARAIGPRLAELFASGGGAIERSAPVAEEPLPIAAVTAQLRRVSGIDFSQYRESTLRRQLQRRMAIRQVNRLEDYLPLLVSEEESQALVHNLLVSVSSFFRDPEVFTSLGELLRAYGNHRTSGERLRVWVPGCATGEEVYAIAMVISEVLGHPADLAAHLKIFGTDLDEQALAIARRGVYSIAAVQAIPRELRQRFVIERDGETVLREDLRTCAVFARHDVGEDPPFPGLDLISCRNTLIYFTPALQARVFDRFRFGLLPGGLLVLGRSETLGSRTPGFTTADAAHRIYARTAEGGTRLRPSQGQRVPRPALPFAARSGTAAADETVPERHIALLEALLRVVCPPALVLDENHDLVEVIGDVTPFCRVPEGRVTAAAHPFLRPALQAEARALLVLVRADGVPLTGQSLQVEGLEGAVHLEASPFRAGDRPFTLLTFRREAGGRGDAPRPTTTARDQAFDREIERLEGELLASQERLRRSLTELEQANEELEASSEELMASSEELQSANEELEASNEELQATNEELATLNQQLGARSDELQQLNVDLENIQASLSQGMVIVDRGLRVTRFSPTAVRVFGLVEADIGQPLLGVPTTVPLPGLAEALQAVINGEPRRSFEASSEEAAYLVQVLPYCDRDGRRHGAIVILTDMTEQVALRRAAEAALTDFSSLTDALNETVWKWDPVHNQLLYVSQRIRALTGWTPAEVCARPGLLDEAIAPVDRAQVTAARDIQQQHWSVRYRLTTRTGRLIWVEESARVVRDDGERFVVGTLADVTDMHALEEGADELSAIHESLFQSVSFGMAVLDGQQRVVMANETFCGLLGFEPGSLEGVSAAVFSPAGELDGPIAQARAGGLGPQIQAPLRLRNREGTILGLQAELRFVRRPAGKDLYTLIVQRPE